MRTIPRIPYSRNIFQKKMRNEGIYCAAAEQAKAARRAEAEALADLLARQNKSMPF